MQLNELLTRQDLLDLENRLMALLSERIPEGFSPNRKWLRSKEVCEWLNISSSTLQNMRDDGSIPFTQLGSTYFYPYQEVEQLLQKSLVQRNWD
ncbi:MAG: helix-turn-helix domain-containing protein [Bacteroidota bacterium]